MCCAVQYPMMPLKMDLLEESYTPFKLSGKITEPKLAPRLTEARLTEACLVEKETVTLDFEFPMLTKLSNNTVLAPTKVVRPKEVISNISNEKKDTVTKKKKKWNAMPLTDLGFNISLFPRPTRPETIDPEEERRILDTIEKELEEYDNTVEKYQDFDVTHTLLFEGKTSKKDKLSRKDRDQKVQKAHNQIKGKYGTSVKNNKGRKKLFIHHRLYKLINLEEKRLDLHLPSRSKYNDKTAVNNSSNKSTNETRSKLNPTRAASPLKPAPVQNLRFALQKNNAANDIGRDLVGTLINLQHRDLTPEDYEILLRLDESVAPKTIDKSMLNSFKTDIVTEETCGDICAVCMDPYVVGQSRKFLPCMHVYHTKCIDMWLENSSRNCPIDGLPIDENS